VSDLVWLNVVRHPQQPVNRRDATWEQFIDPAWQDANDDVHPVHGPAQVAAGAQEVRLDPDRPLLICHSGYRRTRRGAELFAEALRERHPAIELRELPALREAEIVWPAIMTAEEYADPARPGILALQRIVTAIVEDNSVVVRGGRDTIARQMEELRGFVAEAGVVNHLWVGHAPVMPFIYLALVAGLPPEEWTVEGALRWGMFDFARGFSVQSALPERVRG
jgi:broad specificity phosphatase PhoE